MFPLTALIVGSRAELIRKGQNIRRTQEGCGGLGGENPAAFPQARPIFQQPISLPENAQTLAGIANFALPENR